MNKSGLVLVLNLSLLLSCLYNHTAITENLGGNYFYLGDGRESTILFGDEKKNMGVTIVPKEVIEYNFDERYIIAKSIDVGTKDLYWIIDKARNDSIIPLDSMKFTSQIERLKIQLVLKQRKWSPSQTSRRPQKSYISDNQCRAGLVVDSVLNIHYELIPYMYFATAWAIICVPTIKIIIPHGYNAVNR